MRPRDGSLARRPARLPRSLPPFGIRPLLVRTPCTMRIFTIVACLLIFFIGRLAGHALDIGGIQVHLGQNVTDALRTLSPYQVRYDESARLWFVTQKDEFQYDLLGTITATGGRISGITKVFKLHNQYDTQHVYTQASTTLHALGGNLCDTRDVYFTDGQVHTIETQCGLYRLTYFFASRSRDQDIDAGITISVSQRR